MSQVQVANMYGLGDAASLPMFVFSASGMEDTIAASGDTGVLDSDVASLALRSSALVTLLGAVGGAAVGYMLRKKRGIASGALIGAGLGSAYSGYALWQRVLGSGSAGSGAAADYMKLGFLYGGAATALFGGWRAYKGR